MNKPAVLSAAAALSLFAMPAAAATSAINAIHEKSPAQSAGDGPAGGQCAGKSVLKNGKCVRAKGEGLSSANWMEVGVGIAAVTGIAIAATSGGRKPASP